jgi:hypothetical protein
MIACMHANDSPIYTPFFFIRPIYTPAVAVTTIVLLLLLLSFIFDIVYNDLGCNKLVVISLQKF